ncbi:MAG: hypothetical protein QOJ65_378, partial [Fimbriimonadaceae bacterium]|nr:hypothetical protein [Fimbriimonadaceae bacterium]
MQRVKDHRPSLETGQNAGMAHARTLLALSCLAASSFVFGADRSVQVVWNSTGQEVKTVFSYPASKTGKLPLLIIASGRSGGMANGIIKGFADKAVRDGMVAVRFDYAYYADKSEPSKGLVDEAQQLNAVITEALKDPMVDAKRIVISGKSLGSVVAHRAFLANPGFTGEVLLTPVIPTADDGARLYPNLSVSRRPVAIVLGNQDTDNAPLGVVYNFLKEGSRKIMVDVLAGDHGFNVTVATDAWAQRLNNANVDSALETAQYWV